jgi:hypothetical protein
MGVAYNQDFSRFRTAKELLTEKPQYFGKDGYYFLNKDTYLPIYYSSPAPIARMAFFYISLRDEFFRLIDLGNHDFTLVFEITVLG